MNVNVYCIPWITCQCIGKENNIFETTSGLTRHFITHLTKRRRLTNATLSSNATNRVFQLLLLLGLEYKHDAL